MNRRGAYAATIAALLFAPLLIGAKGGCSEDVVIGIHDAGIDADAVEASDTLSAEAAADVPPLEVDALPRYCGGFAGVACDAGEYCHYELGDRCGYADAPGTCRTRATGCTEEYKAVCGCDGNTYSNACYANAAGISVSALGECPK